MREPARPELIGTLLLLAVLRSFTAVCQPPNDDSCRCLTFVHNRPCPVTTPVPEPHSRILPWYGRSVWFTFTTNSREVVDIALTGMRLCPGAGHGQ